MTQSPPPLVARAALDASIASDWRSRSIALIGAGAAGSAMARALRTAGGRFVAVASRTPSHAAVLCHDLGLSPASADASRAVCDADLVLLAVPDTALATVDAQLPWRDGQIVVHLAGALGPGVLAAAGRAGTQTVAFHPLCAFARTGAGALPAGTRFGYTGPEALRPLFEEIAAALGGALLVIPADRRTLYHAAAVLASNDLVTLAAAAADVLAAAGVGREDALDALLPLLRSTVQNLADARLPGALTGPLVRGDVATARRHQQALRGTEAAALYTTLARATAALALRRDDVPAEARAALSALAREEDDPS